MISRAGFRRLTPATLIKVSIRPCSFIMPPTREWMWSGFETSHSRANTGFVSTPISIATSSKTAPPHHVSRPAVRGRVGRPDQPRRTSSSPPSLCLVSQTTRRSRRVRRPRPTRHQSVDALSISLTRWLCPKVRQQFHPRLQPLPARVFSPANPPIHAIRTLRRDLLWNR